MLLSLLLNMKNVSLQQCQSIACEKILKSYELPLNFSPPPWGPDKKKVWFYLSV